VFRKRIATRHIPGPAPMTPADRALLEQRPAGGPAAR
jgi:hypothetical protein